MKRAPLDDDFLDHPSEAPRWVRLMERCQAGHPERFQSLIQDGTPPRFSTLLTAMADDSEAMAEDLALRAWAAWDQEDLVESRALHGQAKSLNPEDVDCRVLDLLLNLEGEPRLTAIQLEAERQRAALPATALELLAEGRGAESTEVVRLHRCLAEQVHLLIELEQWEACVALIDGMYGETGEDTFGVFPALVQAALHTDNLDVLDTWVDEVGDEYPGLQAWLQAYLAEAADQPGAAFQALRRARKALPQLELSLLKWHDAILKAGGPDSEDFPKPVFPKDAQASAAFTILGPSFIASPDFMAWLKKMRSLR